MKLIIPQLQLQDHDQGQNLKKIYQSIQKQNLELQTEDILLLPELVDSRTSRVEYESAIIELSNALKCHVVGGSHHERRGDNLVNSGIVVDPRGKILKNYEKLRPYGGVELGNVQPGSMACELNIEGHHVVVLICADFWFPDLIKRFNSSPEIILVSALSISRRSKPDYAQNLWRHLSIARSYEFGSFVGIADWAHPSHFRGACSSGVSGFADPTVSQPEKLFTPVKEEKILVQKLDFAALKSHREYRLSQGFLWKDDQKVIPALGPQLDVGVDQVNAKNKDPKDEEWMFPLAFSQPLPKQSPDTALIE